MKKLSIIGCAGVPGNYGGFETLAHHLVKHLNQRFDMQVYCSKKQYKKAERLDSWEGANLVYLPFSANGIQSIIYDIISIFHALFTSDILLILGVPGCLILPFVKLFSNKPIIVNIDGLEWKREKWGKWASRFLKWSEGIAVKYADHIVADNAAIQEYVKDEYQSEASMIAYGADHSKPEDATEEDIEKYRFLLEKYTFSVCRIEPENNVELTLETYRRNPDRLLVFVGNWNRSQWAKSLKEKYSQFENIILLDPIYDQRTLNVLRSNCALYIHGHKAGGTNPSLVEAMYAEIPIFCYDVSYNKYTTENKAFYFNDLISFNALLNETLDVEYRLSAKLLKAVAMKRYNWFQIAEQYASVLTNKSVAQFPSTVFVETI